jgi:hypothetical protein
VNLTLFKVHFGLLTLKGYTKGGHVLRFEAIVHNPRALRTGRVLDKFPQIVARLAGMVDRFTSMPDCVDIGFLPDGILDQLPTPSQTGATRVGGLDLNKARTRAALTAVLALAVSPDGFTVADLAAKTRSQTGADNHQYTTRQAAYDPCKLRGKQLLVKPDRTRRYHVPGHAAPHHRRAAHPPRARHRANPGRRPPTPTGTPPEDLHPHRPRLREPPRRHAHPLHPPRDQHRRIDNKLSITLRKPLTSRFFRSFRRSVTTARHGQMSGALSRRTPNPTRM